MPQKTALPENADPMKDCFADVPLHMFTKDNAKRAESALRRGGIDTMEKLCALPLHDLKRIRGLGEKCLAVTLWVRGRYNGA